MTPKKLSPIHPGVILDEEFMAPYGLSQNELARRIKVSPSQINRIVSGLQGISADMALRLARLFDSSTVFWMNLQQHYDLELAEDGFPPELAEFIQPITHTTA
jgi:addiction module HigA family antidote